MGAASRAYKRAVVGVRRKKRRWVLLAGRDEKWGGGPGMEARARGSFFFGFNTRLFFISVFIFPFCSLCCVYLFFFVLILFTAISRDPEGKLSGSLSAACFFKNAQIDVIVKYKTFVILVKPLN
jgi:hypothetical protein